MKYFVTSKLSDNISETPEGFLVCVGVPIARTGEMTYGPGESPIEVGPDGIAIVYREAREVFREETMASFEGKPFTILHPEDFVNPKNWGILAKGTLQNVRRGTGETENDLLADILITDEEAIKLVKSGIREVSCGYEAEYIQLGVGRGMQTNIIGNHLALVQQGRAGTAYAINDQKGAKMKLSEKVKGIFARAGDEAAKVVDEFPPKKDDDDKAKDADTPPWVDALTKKIEDAMAAMSKPAAAGDVEKPEEKKADDAADPEKKVDDADPEKKVDDADPMAMMDERMKKMEDALAALSGTGDADPDDDESEDDDFEETPASTVGDQASRIEILAPGLKAKGKDAKREALIESYKSKDGKSVIENLNGGKAIDLKKASVQTIDHLFLGASEVISLYRTKDFTKWKQVRDAAAEADAGAGAPMSAEKLNEINAKHYAEGAH